MFDKLDNVVRRYDELNSMLSDPNIMRNQTQFRALAKEHAEVGPVVKCYQEYQEIKRQLADSKALLEETNDKEMMAMVKEEVVKLTEDNEVKLAELRKLLLPKDPNDEKNVILELRAGAGGDESSLFAEDLLTLYERYATTQGWRVELLSASHGTVGGYKEVIVRIVGNGVYSALKYERGVHRVQRVPQTETQGRVHTSTVTVAVLPEAEEVEIDIDDKDLRIDVFRASGPGGQSVNTTDSAVRVTHLPTGLVVSCQDEKSQIKNKNKAMTVLRARLLDLKQAAADAERRDDRRSQIGTGDRSERIRTYNFPQGRVTDHRIGLTLYQLDDLMNGNLTLMNEPLRNYFQAEALKGQES